MQEDTWNQIAARQTGFETLVQGQGPPVTEAEIEQAACELGLSFPAEYREFLLRLGGAVIGAYALYGLRPVEFMGDAWSVMDANRALRTEGWPGIEEWLIICEDGRGNPIGLAPDGQVRVVDHDCGFETRVLAASFEDFIRRKCLSLDS